MTADGSGTGASSCCAPTTGRSASEPLAATARPAGPDGMVTVPGTSFRMGYEGPLANEGDGEGPVRTVTVSSFRLDATAVTNAAFAGFVADTSHVTTAEHDGWSFVFAGRLDARRLQTAAPVPGAPWWRQVEGASWHAPEGPGSTVDERGDHPVVHVSHHDASAYAAWAVKRLPTEAEWELAARGGLDSALYPWGDELVPDGRWRCNIWQGSFPDRGRPDDGHLGTAPVRSYPPNGFGLYEVVGNVWEWVADRWAAQHPTGPKIDPTGPSVGELRVRRGGSHLCHDSYCNRYRVAARDRSHPADTTANIGFRCAADA